MSAEKLCVPDKWLDVSRDTCFRRLFYQLINVERFPGAAPEGRAELNRYLEELTQTQESNIDRPVSKKILIDYFSKNARNFSTDIVLNYAQCAYALQQYAPIALTEASWLESTFQAAIGHTKVSAALFLIYSELSSGVKKGTATHDYRYLLQQYGLTLPALYTRTFSLQANVADASFCIPVLQQSLALYSRTYLAEIIGYTLAWVFNPAFLSFLSRSITSADSTSASRQEQIFSFGGAGSELQTIGLMAAGSYLDSFTGVEEIYFQSRKIWLGIRLYELLIDSFWSGLSKHLRSMPNAADTVLAVFRQKARYAKGYHEFIRIGDKTLDEWFEDGISDGQAFLEGLIGSGYFDADQPENCRFIKEFISPNGPMFGVFSASDIDTILGWLRSKSNKPGRSIPVDSNASRPLRIATSTYQHRTANIKLSNRELYYRLINVEMHREVLPAARVYVDRCLRWARFQSSCLTQNRCSPYSHERFHRYIETSYRREMEAYQPVVGRPKLSKNVYIWGIEQFAPTLLVDGCWLQKITKVKQVAPEIGERLWSIYADEIGHGRSRENHPNVYRRLLHELKIKLPPVGTREFAEHPGFLDSAFDLPVYFLAISQSPHCYLPEILGLNMAIELSGLGAGYMRLAESMEYWGIDARIVRLHLSIDNLASGHSALAKEAIELYLDQIRVISGEAEMQRQWQRIWAGYLSLATVPRVFKYRLIWHYVMHFGRHSLWRKCLGGNA